MEGAKLSEMIDEDDSAGHHAEHAHAILRLEVIVIVLEDVDADVREQSETIDEVRSIV